jgi:hypothetical protein
MARIFCHSLDGKGFAAKRVGQEMLQGFHLVPPPFLCRLHDTNLESANDAMRFPPINGVPALLIV